MQKIQRMGFFIHQKSNWPNFIWNTEDFVDLLSEARNLQGRLSGKMESLGFGLRKMPDCSQNMATKNYCKLVSNRAFSYQSLLTQKKHKKSIKKAQKIELVTRF